MTIVYRDVILIMAATCFAIGIGSLVSGIIVLITRSGGKDLDSLRAHTASLAQKGIADEISGLVGNTTALIDAMDQLIRTSRGIGFLLVFIGSLLILFSYHLILQVNWA